MSTDPLAVPRFRLSVAQEAVKARIALIDAEIRYRTALADIALKQEELREKRDKRFAIRRARKRFVRQVQQFKRDRRQILFASERISKKSEAANRLEAGEEINKHLLNSSWSGFFAMINTVPSARRAMRARINDSERQGDNFINPRYPDKAVVGPGADARTVRSLFSWARRKHVVPVSGAPAQERLFSILDAIEEGSQTQLERLIAATEKVEQKLAKLQEANWKALDLLASAE